MKIKKKLNQFIWKTGRKILGNNLNSKKLSFLEPLAYQISSQIDSETVNVFGNQMILGDKGPLSMELSIYGIWEPIETDFVRNTIKNNEVVLDIGANIGYYTLILAKLVGDGGQVFCFEPEPNNFQKLKKNIEKNKYQNVVCENIAISNKNGEIQLYLSERSIGQHKIYNSDAVSEKSITVKTSSLDNYFKNNKLREKISFIKIDIEGAEFFVLDGMQTILKNNKKLKILLEFDPNQIKDSGTTSNDLLNLLNGEGFEFFFVNQKKHEFEKCDVNFLINNFVRKGKTTNLLCIRK